MILSGYLGYNSSCLTWQVCTGAKFGKKRSQIFYQIWLLFIAGFQTIMSHIKVLVSQHSTEFDCFCKLFHVMGEGGGGQMCEWLGLGRNEMCERLEGGEV